MVFHKEKESLCLHLKFPPKVSSEFNINQSIHLSVFFPRPHTYGEETSLHHHLICPGILPAKNEASRSRKIVRELVWHHWQFSLGLYFVSGIISVERVQTAVATSCQECEEGGEKRNTVVISIQKARRKLKYMQSLGETEEIY
ncbi:unnamed protein product [Caretta caretta]